MIKNMVISTRRFLNPGLITVFVVGLIFFTGCRWDDSAIAENIDNLGKPIILVSGMSNTRAADTGLQDGQIVAGVKVGSFVISENSMISDNAELEAEGNGMLVGNAGNYPDTGNVSVYAYAPYDSSWGLYKNNSFKIASDQSDSKGYLASDLLRGIPSGTNSFDNKSEAIELNFKHLLSKIIVKVDNNTSDVNLVGSTVSILGVKTTVTLNVFSGRLGVASGDMTDVNMVTIDAGNVNLEGSAVVVPQRLEAGKLFRISTKDGFVIDASILSPIEFESGMIYKYRVNLTGNGNSVEAIVNADASASDWEDDVVISNEGWKDKTYGIGDYVLRDGSLMKSQDAMALDEYEQNYVAAVIFSTSVSPEDAAVGYEGYAVSVGGRKSGATWRIPGGNEATPLLRNEPATKIADAFEALDGVTISESARNAADGGVYDAFDFTNYSYVNSLRGTNLSGWFVPSLGQMTQLLNNLGKANVLLPSDVKLDNLGEFEFTDVDMASVIENVNSHNIGENNILRDKGTNFFISSTEYDNERVWGYTIDAENEILKLHSLAGKYRGGRNVLCCVAYKIPSQ